MSTKFEKQFNYPNFALTKRISFGKTRPEDYENIKQKKIDEAKLYLGPIAAFFDEYWTGVFLNQKSVKTLKFDPKIEVNNYKNEKGKKYLTSFHLNEVNIKIYILLEKKPSEDDLEGMDKVLQGFSSDFTKSRVHKD